MKLWRLSQTLYNGLDMYDSCVVAATTEEKARLILPAEDTTAWPTADYVDVEYLGTAKKGTKQGVILASFNAA